MILEELVVLISAKTKGVKEALKVPDTIASKYGGLASKVAGVGAILGGALIGTGIAAAKTAASIQETENLLQTVFGNGSEAFKKFADDLAARTQSSKFELRELGAEFQILLKNQIGDTELARQATQDLLERARDLASIKEMPVAEVMQDIRAALSGSMETMQKYGANLKVNQINESAFAKQLGKTWQEMTQAEKSMALYSEILNQTQFAHKDATDTADSLANTMTGMRTKTADLWGQIAQGLTPTIEKATQAIAKVTDKFFEWADANGGVGAKIDMLVLIMEEMAIPALVVLTGVLTALAVVAIIAAMPFIIMAAKVTLVISAVMFLVYALKSLYDNFDLIAAFVKDSLATAFDFWAEKLEMVWQKAKELWDMISNFAGGKFQAAMDFLGLDGGMDMPTRRPGYATVGNTTQNNQLSSQVTVNANGADAQQVAKIVQQQQQGGLSVLLQDAHKNLTPAHN
jgi:hypothetical protein